MPQLRIAILDDHEGFAEGISDWDQLEQCSIHAFRDIVPQAALCSALQDFQIVVLMRERTQLTSTTLSCLPSLRLVVTTGPKNSAIDVAAARALGIEVCGTGASPHATVELTWALILGWMRHIPLIAHEMRTGRWPKILGRSLVGSQLGVIGLGRIGSGVARVAQAFGLEVVAWSPNLTAERAATHDVTFLDKWALLESSDIVSIHMALTPETRLLVDEPELDALGTNSLLVNTSRGELINEAALVKRLETGQIGGAALDVYQQEPLPDIHPLRSLPNVLLTSHVGFATQEVFASYYADVIEDIVAFLAGSPIRRLAS
jgi:phosphoglycerate dehydrogenase-like enzyme